jgi:TolB-like protein/Tfp pilus assembly protein PilF
MSLLIAFDDFEVDVHARELRRGGSRVRIQEQPFQLLAMLLERPGEAVLRDDIRRRLWPDGTFVDFEHSMNAAVKRLRQALGDVAERPRYVETVPRFGYRFIGRLGGPAATRTPARAAVANTARRPRLVVLPFANLSDGAQDYFSDGLTEEMIAQLGRRCATHIGVLARTSSMLYKNVVRGAAEIGEALRADYLVEGSVRQSGDRVRITAQLIETRGETHLWAESYDRELSDCLAVQTDVAAAIAHALALELLPTQNGMPAITRIPEAYQAFLRGRYHWNRQGEQGLVEAIQCYDEALAIDPRFGKALTARARARLSLADYYIAAPRVALEAARRDALAALALDAADAEAHLAVAEVRRTLDWDWRGAESSYCAALSANPNSDATLRYYAMFLAARRRREAVPTVDRARDLDPLCLTANTAVGHVHYLAGDFAGAVEQFAHTVAMDAEYAAARRGLAAALIQVGRIDDAIATLNVIPERQRDPVTEAALGYALAAGGNADAARAIAARLERPRADRHVPPFHRGLLRAGLGEIDRAFSDLEQACELRDPALDTLAVEPRFAVLRGDARFHALVNRLALATASQSLAPTA